MYSNTTITNWIDSNIERINHIAEAAYTQEPWSFIKQESQPTDLPSVEITTFPSSGVKEVQFKKKLTEYSMEMTYLKSPRVAVCGGTGAAVASMECAAQWVLAERRADVFEKLAANLAVVKSDGSVSAVTRSGGLVSGMTTPPEIGDINFKSMEKVHRVLSIVCAQSDYAVTGKKPTFHLVAGKDAILQANMVPFYGFLCLPGLNHPRRYNNADGRLVQIQPRLANGSYNEAYDHAEFETAYACGNSVYVDQIPVNGFFHTQWIPSDSPTTETEGNFHLTLRFVHRPLHVGTGFVLLFRRPAPVLDTPHQPVV